MKTFEYRGFDASSGKALKGLAEAVDIKQAREKLAADNILAEQVFPVDEARKRWGLLRVPEFTLDKRTIFYQELVSLIRAGLPIVACMDVLIQSQEMAKARPLLANVRDKLKEGTSLADALAGVSKKVSPYEKAVIAAGERIGMLDLVLERLAGFLGEQNRLREQLITALIYPALIVIVAIGIAIGLLGVTVPRFGQMLQEETSLALPWLTRFMISLGSLVATWGLPLMIVIVAGVVATLRYIKSDSARIQAMNRVLFRLPVIGTGYTALVNLRFARTLSLLLHGGVQLIDAMKLAGEATGSSWVSHLLTNQADSVKHGASLADALRKIQPMVALAGWIHVGEASGALEHLLKSAGDRFEQQWERFLSRVTVLIEPVLILIIGIFVLLVVLSILLPIMSLNQQIL